MGETRTAHKILIKKSLGKFYEDNIKIDIRERHCEDGRWVELAEILSRVS